MESETDGRYMDPVQSMLLEALTSLVRISCGLDVQRVCHTIPTLSYTRRVTFNVLHSIPSPLVVTSLPGGVL